MITSVTLPNCVSGDHCDEQPFQLKTLGGVVIDITDCLIELRTTRDSHVISTADGGLVITNAATGEFKMIEQKIDWEPALYTIKISITYTDGRKKTYIWGNWTIL